MKVQVFEEDEGVGVDEEGCKKVHDVVYEIGLSPGSPTMRVLNREELAVMHSLNVRCSM